MDNGVISTLVLLWVMLLWTFRCKFLLRHVFSCLCHLYPEVELLGHMITLRVSRCWGANERYSPHFTFPPAMYESCQHSLLCGSSTTTIPQAVKWHLIVGFFGLHFPDHNDVDNPFMSLLAISVSSLEKCLFNALPSCSSGCQVCAFWVIRVLFWDTSFLWSIRS
jgi:hypothetical protein